MRSAALKLLLFVVAGAIINVAVAWGCATCSQFHPYALSLAKAQRWIEGRDSPEWAANQFIGFEGHGAQRWIATGSRADNQTSLNWFDVTVVWAGAYGSTGGVDHYEPYSMTIPAWVRIEEDQNDRKEVEPGFSDARGYPCLALSCDVVLIGVRPIAPRKVIDGFRIPPSKTHSDTLLNIRVLPYRIIWPGFAINTIFYAAIVWMLFAAPGAIRRHMRRKHGQCAACGYSLL